MTQNWMGISIDFGKVEDKTSESSFELLKEGFYRATIKSVNKSELGEKHRPALTITMTLDDVADKEITHSLYLPEVGDKEAAVKFKNENLRNFFTHYIFRQLTKEEFAQLDNAVITAELQKVITTQPNFAGAKVLIDLRQEPFISKDKDTKAIKWTDKPFNANICTKPVLKVIQELQKSGVEVDKFPVILFSNKVSAYGFGFYNDYNENAELKNSPSYDFIQSLGASASMSETVTDNGEIAF